MIIKKIATSNPRLARTIAVAPAVAVLTLFSVPAFAAEWGQTNKIIVTATDNVSVTGYYKTRVNSPSSPAPSAPAAVATGWQASNEFVVNQNGFYYIWAKDAAGNVSLQETISVSSVDVDAPIISDVTKTPAIGEGVIIKVIASDLSSGVSSYSFDNGVTWQTENTFTVITNTSIPAGYIQVKDGVGNTALYPNIVAVNGVDVERPAIESVSASSLPDETSTVTITATDNQGVTGYLLTKDSTPPASDSDEWQWSNKFVVGVNGTYYAWAKDAFGNVSAIGPNTKVVVSKIVSVPLAVPDIKLSAPDPDADTVTLTITPPDTDRDLEYSFDGGETWQPDNELTIPADTTIPAGEIQIRDDVGNVTVYPSPVVVDEVDNVSPIVKNAFASPLQNETSTITVTATDNKGVTGYLLTKTSTPPTNNTSGWQTSNKFIVDANGTYYAWAKDAFGNVSAVGLNTKVVVSSIVSVPKKDVDIKVSAPDPDTDTVTLTITPPDTDRDLEYSIDGGETWQPDNEFSIPTDTSIPAGEIQIRDDIGNVTVYPTPVVIDEVDNTSPVVSYVAASSSSGKTNTITVTATDNSIRSIITRITKKQPALRGWLFTCGNIPANLLPTATVAATDHSSARGRA